MVSLKEMKEKYNAQSTGASTEFWSPMQDLSFGESAKIRFVPAIDAFSGMFWAEKKSHIATLISPENEDEEWRAFLPSLENYTEKKGVCPLANRVRSIYKESDKLKDEGRTKESDVLREVGKQHWMTYTYYFEGFIDGSEELKSIKLPKTIVKYIKDTVFGKDSLFETLPTGEFSVADITAYVKGEVPPAYDNKDAFVKSALAGRELVIKKTKKDEWANYESTSWGLKDHNLTKGQIDYIAEHGFSDLRSNLPPQGDTKTYETYIDILKASIDNAMGDASNVWDSKWDEVIAPVKPKSGT